MATIKDCISRLIAQGVDPIDAKEVVDLMLQDKARLIAEGSQNIERDLARITQARMRDALYARERALGLKDLDIIAREKEIENLEKLQSQGVSLKEAFLHIFAGEGRMFKGARDSIARSMDYRQKRDLLAIALFSKISFCKLVKQIQINSQKLTIIKKDSSNI